MQQLMSVWTGMDPRRRIIVIGATLAVFLAVLALGRIATKPGMALLYAGLDGGAAGEVIEALDQNNALYEVRGDAIYVPRPQRDEIRMTLAGQGLPANGGQGYELLDGMSGFGTTAQMFDAAYLRAKEGELARTIVSSPHVRAARVHIAQPMQQPFRREIAPTASVTVTPAAGGLPGGHANALRFLVASAVTGLRAEDVSVIDGVGGRILSSEGADQGPPAGGDRAEGLRRSVARLLEAHVGPGRAVVEVSVETRTERESIVERLLDPDSRVAVLSDTEERSSSSADAGGAGVTVASNLPDGDAASDNGESRSQDSETRERVTFDVSETQRELHRPAGEIRRLSVAVLIDGVREPGADGVVQWRPHTEGELAELRDLVASAVGYDDARGDVITLKSLRFEPAVPQGTAAEPGFFDRIELDVMSLVQLVVLAVVALALILFVIRPMLAPARSNRNERLSAGTSGAPPALSGPDAASPSDVATSIDDAAANGTDGPPPLGALPAIADFGMAPGFGPDADAGDRGSDPVARLRRLIEERQDETVEILRSWMEDGEEEKT